MKQKLTLLLHTMPHSPIPDDSMKNDLLFLPLSPVLLMPLSPFYVARLSFRLYCLRHSRS